MMKWMKTLPLKIFCKGNRHQFNVFLWLLWKEQYNDDDDEENYIHI